MRESVIEKRLVDCTHANGGIAPKFKSPQRRGAPDRLLLLGFDGALFNVELLNASRSLGLTPVECRVLAKAALDGGIRFAECKAPGAKPEPHQEREHERLRALGFRVDIVDSLEAAEMAPAK